MGKGIALNVFERIRQIRKYRHLTQDDIASWFNISPQSWGQKEKGKEGGFGPTEIQFFLEKTQIDARYIFGQIDKIEDSDLRFNKKEENIVSAVREMALEYEKKLSLINKKEDPLLSKLRINKPLRDILEKLANLPANDLYAIDGLIFSYQATKSSSQKKIHQNGIDLI